MRTELNYKIGEGIRASFLLLFLHPVRRCCASPVPFILPRRLLFIVHLLFTFILLYCLPVQLLTVHLVNSRYAMVNLCAVCKVKDTLRKFHFPKKRRLEWDALVPIKDFKSDDNTVLCEKHFDLSDFAVEVESTEQKTATRKRLTSDAVPRLWPGLPAYLSKPKPKPRETKLSTSFSREEKEAILACREEKSEINNDTFTCLQDLQTKFTTEDLPPGITRIVHEGDVPEDKKTVRVKIMIPSNTTGNIISPHSFCVPSVPSTPNPNPDCMGSIPSLRFAY